MSKKLKITLKKSPIGSSPKHKRTIQSLGLRKLNQKVIQKDTPAVRGMINKIVHLVEVVEEKK